MSEKIQANGRCLCGAVNIAATGISRSAGACHCGMCRRWGGGPLIATDCGTEVSIEGEENVSVYSSSVWAERGFCSQCGSHLFYRLKESGQYIMPPGLFDIEGELVLDHQVFIDEKPSYYSFSNKTEDMTGAEVFAKYAPSSE